MTITFLRGLPKRYWFYGAVLFGLALSPLWRGPAPREFRLRGSAAEMGAQFGRQARLAVQLLCRVYVRGFICRNDARIYRERCGKAMDLWGGLEPAYRAELDALASAAGVDRAAVLLGNSFIDLGYSAYGCRAVAVRAPGGMLHGHNLDWDSVGGLANWSVSLIRRDPGDGRFRTVTVGLPGMIGALDIANDQGLCLSLNQISFGRGVATEPAFVKLRRIAETCATYEQARRKLLAPAPDMPFVITLSSAREGLSGVFEPGLRGPLERPARQGRSWADNGTWGTTGCGGSALGQVVVAARLESSADVQSVLRHPDVLLGCNIYSVVFEPARNRLHIASGRTPAAAGHYRRYELFAHARPQPVPARLDAGGANACR